MGKLRFSVVVGEVDTADMSPEIKILPVKELSI